MDGVQVNMTNTMNTPIESLEMSFPLRVESYELRENTGGAGLHRGGWGVTRAIRVIGHTARVSLQSDRRTFAPYGLHGGAEGQKGRDELERADQTRIPLKAKGSFTAQPGELIIVQTPGGGGWGKQST
jgi:N-methylhydantoinase B